MYWKALSVAERAADLAGERIRRAHRRLRREDVEEKSADDFVTRVDVEVERAVRRFLEAQMPSTPVMAEEEGGQTGSLQWVVDPLDGTNNFVFGMPCVAVSLALLEEGQPVVAVVDLPLLGERYRAVRGAGAWDHRGERMQVRPARGLQGALLATGFPFRKPHLRDRYFRLFHRVFPQVVDLRRAGAAAMDLAYVGAGIFTGFFELGLSPWDVAAGMLIIEEAGGVVRTWTGEGPGQVLRTGEVLAGAPPLVDALLRLIEQE